MKIFNYFILNWKTHFFWGEVIINMIHIGNNFRKADLKTEEEKKVVDED